MRHFDEIFAIAADRHGGPAALEGKLTKPDPEITALPEDRWLSVMTRCVFNAELQLEGHRGQMGRVRARL